MPISKIFDDLDDKLESICITFDEMQEERESTQQALKDLKLSTDELHKYITSLELSLLGLIENLNSQMRDSLSEIKDGLLVQQLEKQELEIERKELELKKEEKEFEEAAEEVRLKDKLEVDLKKTKESRAQTKEILRNLATNNPRAFRRLPSATKCL